MYMKLTNQPVSPSTTAQRLTNETDPHNLEIVKNKIATACDKRAQECLENSRTSTKIYLQQPIPD